MAYELCNNLSKFHSSGENGEYQSVYVHFLEGNSEKFCSKSSIHDIFTYVADLDKLLYHQDFSFKSDIEKIYEDFNKFCSILKELESKSTGNEKERENILNNKLEYYYMLRSFSELGVVKEGFDLNFSDLELCQVERDRNLEFDDVIAVLYDIFPNLSRESSEIIVIFHDLQEFPSRFFLLLELFEKVGIDVVFSFSENVGFTMSEFSEKFSPFGFIFDDYTVEESGESTLFKKYGQIESYFLHKDAWLVLFFDSLVKM